MYTQQKFQMNNGYGYSAKEYCAIKQLRYPCKPSYAKDRFFALSKILEHREVRLE